MKTTIKIELRHGDKSTLATVPGDIVILRSGIACFVHRDIAGIDSNDTPTYAKTWCVTHARTGRRIAGGMTGSKIKILTIAEDRIEHAIETGMLLKITDGFNVINPEFTDTITPKTK